MFHALGHLPKCSSPPQPQSDAASAAAVVPAPEAAPCACLHRYLPQLLGDVMYMLYAVGTLQGALCDVPYRSGFFCLIM